MVKTNRKANSLCIITKLNMKRLMMTDFVALGVYANQITAAGTK